MGNNDNAVARSGEGIPIGPWSTEIACYPTLHQVGKELASSYDLRTERGRIQAVIACNSDAVELEDLIGTVIGVKDVTAVLMPERLREGKMQDPWWRIIIDDGEGLYITCGSTGALKQLYTMAQATGPLPWTPPKQFEVKQWSKGPRRGYSLIPVLLSEPEPAPAAPAAPPANGNRPRSKHVEPKPIATE